MIAVLCETFIDAKMCFYIFLDMLEEECIDPDDIMYHSYSVIVDHIKYIFADWRFHKAFEKMGADCIGEDSFFDDVDLYYEKKWRTEHGSEPDGIGR